jgi:hypothetical protein
MKRPAPSLPPIMSALRLTRRLLAAAMVFFGTSHVFGHATDLFLSEYVEGSANNKALEIFNGTGEDVALAGYALRLYSNGATEPGVTLPLDRVRASLEAGGVLVVKHAGFTAFTGSAHPSGVANFNGDDVVALTRDGAVIDVIGTIGVRENSFADLTLRRLPEVAGPRATFDAAEWMTFPRDTFEGLGSHLFAGGGIPKPEPSAYPADFAVSAGAEGSLVFTWTDAVGETPPDRYVLLVTSSPPPLLPVDGIPSVPDPDARDGEAVLVVPPGVEGAVIGEVAPATTYTAVLVPFTNLGTAVDYKTDGTPPTVTVTSTAVLLHEPFQDLAAWTVVTLGAEREWNLVDGAAQANAFGSSGPADDWLIAGPFDLGAGDNLVLRFSARLGFDDAGFNPALSVLLSLDYEGAGTGAAVEEANWIPLPVSLPSAGTAGFVPSGDVPLSGYDAPAYLAFRYQSSGTGASDSERWEIDDVRILPSPDPMPRLLLDVVPTRVLENSGSGAATLTVALAADPAAGYPLVVALAADPPGVVTMPGELVFAAEDERVRSVPLSPVPDGVATGDRMVTLSAAAEGFLGGETVLEVADAASGGTGEPRVMSLSIHPGTIEEGATATGTLSLSSAPEDALVVTLTSTPPAKLTMPPVLALAAGERVRTFVIEAGLDGMLDPDQPVTVRATAPGWSGTERAVTVRPVEVARVATLTLREAVLREGEHTLAELVLSVAPERNTVVPLETVADLALPATITIPAGEERVSFVVEAVAGDGFELEGTATVRVSVPGFPDAEATLTIVNTDPRGLLVAPAGGARFGVEPAILLRATVADPIGSLEAVEFYAGDELIDSLAQPPFEVSFDPGADLREALLAREGNGVEVELRALVRDGILGDAVLGPVTISLFYLPPRVDLDFIRQTWIDLAGVEPGAVEAADWKAALAAGTSRAVLVAEALASGTFTTGLEIVQLHLLVLGRLPTGAELAAALPDGSSSTAEVLLHSPEAADRFGGSAATLPVASVFPLIWRERHGVAPTPQQLVQAATREARYGSRAAFLLGLVREDRLEGGRNDIIYNPPNRRLPALAPTALARLAFWPEHPATRAEVDALLPGEGDLAPLLDSLWRHPRYWDRFGYRWLHAVPAAEKAGWASSDWFGWFYLTAESWPWAWHLQHGWMAVGSDDAGGAGSWWWDPEWGWLWSDAAVHPWMWRDAGRTWLYYLPGSRHPRLFWDPTRGQWRAGG